MSDPGDFATIGGSWDINIYRYMYKRVVAVANMKAVNLQGCKLV